VLVVGEGDVVDQRYVTLGPRQDDGTIEVTDGLDGTERYIVNGMLRARPGFPVTPQSEADVAAAQLDAAPAEEN
jgi:multidrug efflux pump subunit AcrA (membrane-fusion protein)